MSGGGLKTLRVPKVWGRSDLPAPFDGPESEPIGEIWFEPPPALDAILAKYLFTSEKLSVQVHPFAAASPTGCGKEECWLVVDAEPGATIGLGLKREVGKDELRAAALDGSIEQLLAWHEVSAGDFLYIPAGTVHAIGPGLTLVEVQQNVDLTYRLYDYGRPRELHLEEGIAASNPIPYVAPHIPHELVPGRNILANGPAFVLERWSISGAGTLAGDGRPVWLVPLAGGGSIDGEPFEAGGVWLVEEVAELALDPGTDMLVAYPGLDVNVALWRAD